MSGFTNDEVRLGNFSSDVLSMKDGLMVIPIYEIVSFTNIGYNNFFVNLVNVNNGFDNINIKVDKAVWDNLSKYDRFFIHTRTFRTWRTLWFGKEVEYGIIGNALGCDKQLLIKTSKEQLSREDIKLLREDYDLLKLGGR